MNLNLKILLNEKSNFLDQIIKINEEYREVVSASLCLNRLVINTPTDPTDPEILKAEKHLLEECLDLIQATINLVDVYKLTDKIPEALIDHYKKLDSRGWTYKDI